MATFSQKSTPLTRWKAICYKIFRNGSAILILPERGDFRFRREVITSMAKSKEILEMFGGLKPSAQAQDVVVRALRRNDIDRNLVEFRVTAAVDIAREEGRTKVGFFGNVGRPLEALREEMGRSTTRSGALFQRT
jgi:hypothetical protein